MKPLSRAQTEVIIKNGQAKGLSGEAVLNGLIKRGYAPEGIDVEAAKQSMAPAPTATTDEAPTEGIVKDTTDDFKQIGTDILAGSQKRVDNINEIRTAMKNGDQGALRSLLQTVGQVAGAGADAIGAVAKGAAKIILPPAAEKQIKQVATQFGQQVATRPEVKNIIKFYTDLSPEHKRDVDAAGGVVSLVSNFIGGEVAGKGGTLIKDAAEAGIDVTKRTVQQGVAAAKGASDGVVDTILSKGKDLVDTLASPEVSDSVKTSLNPTESLKKTGQDLLVSVKESGEDGTEKTVLKKLSELTPDEKASVQTDTKENLDTFKKQAQAFKDNREAPGGSPLEIVGKRTDDALEVANKQRQAIGSEMGTIEEKYLENPLPVSDDTLSAFKETIKNIEKPKYGVDTGGAQNVKKLVEDFDALEQSGATVGERLQFVRDWQSYLRDSRDSFGNFKEHASVNTKIEQAINKIRNETVDHIAEVDKNYGELRKQYAKHIKLQEIGDGLLGKDGALGERIKGAATVKRAIHSNSDAGARQFLTELKNVTGYDAMKEGDLAITAMDLVGDSQQLSLLGIINDGKKGLFKRGLKAIVDKVAGDDATKIDRYIKK